MNAALWLSLQALSFSDITGETIVSTSPEMKCDRVTSICALTRKSFGGVTIEDSMIFSNKRTDKVSVMLITIDPLAERTTIAALTAKYGAPSSDQIKKEANKTGGQTEYRHVKWKPFSDGGTLEYSRGDVKAFVAFKFPQNIDPPDAPKVDF